MFDIADSSIKYFSGAYCAHLARVVSGSEVPGSWLSTQNIGNILSKEETVGQRLIY